MRAILVASAMFALALLNSPLHAGFPNGSLVSDGPGYGYGYGASGYGVPGFGSEANNGSPNNGAPKFRLADASQLLRNRIGGLAENQPPPAYAQEFGAPYGAPYAVPNGRPNSANPQFAGTQYGTPEYFGRAEPVQRLPAPRQASMHRVAQYDGFGQPYARLPAAPMSPPAFRVQAVSANVVQDGAILHPPGANGNTTGHVHGPGCASGNCGGETVHSDVLLNSVPDGPPETIPGPGYPSYPGPSYQEPIYQTYEGGDCFGGYDSSPYCESMSCPTWDVGSEIAKACPTWFGGVYGLIMTRDGDEDYCLLSSVDRPTHLFFSSGDFDTDFSGGVEGRVGRTFNCCRWGLELVYWGLYPGDEMAAFDAAVTPVTGLRTTLDYSPLNDVHGQSLASYTDSVVYARGRRNEEYHNIEVNILSGPLTLGLGNSCAPCDPCPPCGPCDPCGSSPTVVGYDGGYGGGTYMGAGYPVHNQCGSGGGRCGSGGYQYGYGDGYGQGFYGEGCGNRGCSEPRWIANWVFGVRYLRTSENVLLDYSSAGPEIQGVTGEVCHHFRAKNDLVGVQLGVDINRCLARRFTLDFNSRFGLYGNHARTRQQISTPDGFAVNPADDREFNLRGSDSDVAFLGELRAGVGYKVGKHLRFTGGYRAIAASGVATALGQTPFSRELNALDKIADVDSDDSIVLHGAYAGAEFAW